MNNTRAYSHSVRIYLLEPRESALARVRTHTYRKRARIYEAITCTAMSIIARIRHECTCTMWPPLKTAENPKLPIPRYKLFAVIDIEDDVFIIPMIRQLFHRLGKARELSPYKLVCERSRYFIRREFPDLAARRRSGTFCSHFYNKCRFVFLISKDFKRPVIDDPWCSWSRLVRRDFLERGINVSNGINDFK